MKKIPYLLLILCLALTSGCYTVRKKFIRKKEIKKEETVYVDFKEYPEEPKNETYSDYALFLRSWLDEALKTIEMSGNRKRVSHSLDEAKSNMESIIDLCDDRGKAAFKPLHDELSGVKADFDKRRTTTMLDHYDFKLRIESIKKKFESHFKYSRIKEWLK